MALLTAFIVTLAACSHFCHVEGNTTPETCKSKAYRSLNWLCLCHDRRAGPLTWVCTAVAILQTFRDEMVKVGPHWAYALEVGHVLRLPRSATAVATLVVGTMVGAA